ncbi:recombinase family protein [Oceanibium sediminis]|uniref:recombinase family protein n=1 Tax=Oceanibium sediminis TaxID=2026339 RepID=UPI000DD43985|nr:recombinase family protein [Oceanibium sediminis]
MGGVPSLEYGPHPDPKIRGLVINAQEAETVQTIFDLYDHLGCLNAVMNRANELHLRSKRHLFQSGRAQGGNPFSHGQIYALLRNPIYIGKISHKSRFWDGQHAAIVDAELWDKVDAKLQAGSARPRSRQRSAGNPCRSGPASLTGKLRDATGDRLTPTHTRRHGQQLRYYVSNRLISGGTDPQGWRLPAAALEQTIVPVVVTRIDDRARTHRICHTPDLHLGDEIRTRAQDLARRFSQGTLDLLADLVADGRLAEGRIILDLDAAKLAREPGLDPGQIDPAVLQIKTPFTQDRRGVEGKIVAGKQKPDTD